MRTNPKTVYFKFHHAAALESLPDKIFHSLASGWGFKTLSISKERRDFYDTFAWQAFEKSIVIVKKKKVIYLTDLKSGQEITSMQFPGNHSLFFSSNFSDCVLKEKLGDCSTIRAFIKLCSIDAFIRSYRVLDENEKTIATLTLESLSLANRDKPKPFTHLLSLTPLKGYEEEIGALQQSLSLYDENIHVLDFSSLFLLIMHAAGRNVQDYSSKINLTLDPDAPIHESIRRLLHFTFSVMRLNEKGIKKNIDSEFLHDYRVAIRRTRSILKQLDGVFDAKETAYLLNLFRDLGKRTNELRDRDVCLLRQEIYYHYLPPFLRPPLKIFFSNIIASRRILHQKFCGYLGSSAYLSFLAEWNAFVNRPSLLNNEQSPNAFSSTRSVAVSTIKKAWKKVIRRGRQISPEATDIELHILRIDCKKLRYLLEFFASIFPHKTIIPVIGQLKELQENLGDFVDFAVQLRFLHEQFESMPADKFLAASTGGLMTILFQKKEKSRIRFHKTFSSFDHEETSQLFQDLLMCT